MKKFKIPALFSIFSAALFMGLFAVVSTTTAQDLSTPSAEGSQAYIVSPKDGDTVEKTFTVVFGLKGMGVAPAGTEKEHTGHHHLMIDKAELPPEGLPLGTDVKHFGKGQTETTITLEPGTHTLQLILGNHLHVPHTPPVISEKITITVE